MMRSVKAVTAVQLALALFIHMVAPQTASAKNRTWNWDRISEKELANISVPKGFLWGTATCEYQNSGATHCSHNNWAAWENQKSIGGKRTIKYGQKSGVAADHWNLYKEDIKLMKELGVNSYRFSVEWSEIEPREGYFDEAVIQHYVDVVDELIKNDITPMITLFHFTYPQWFSLRGGFEDSRNISYFVRFSKKIFSALQGKVKLWCTINEPTVIMLMGYMLGEFTPGKTDFYLAGVVLRNLLQAHCAVYETLKAQPGGKEAQIGIVHAALKFVPRRWWNPIEAIPCAYFTHVKYDAILHFFLTGNFEWYTPYGLKVSYTNKKAKKSLDFFGLNYYSRAVIGMQMNLERPLDGMCFPGEVMTDMPYASYPEGLYEAIKDVSRLKVPIYITENGIADCRDDRRATFIKRYIYSMSKAIEDGYDVRGYFYWTLTDNFEWSEGFLMSFGLYKVDYKTQKRTLREGSKAYQDIIARTKADKACVRR